MTPFKICLSLWLATGVLCHFGVAFDIYSVMGLLIFKCKPDWQEISVESLILRPVGLLILIYDFYN